jgi:outer membrane receptor for ferrienterochelin and colicin
MCLPPATRYGPASADNRQSSGSRKPQKVSATAAIFVITQNDLRSSRVTSIPVALRLAPGLSVARTDGSKGPIFSRSFNGRFANRLLVLIDGRSVYSPLLSEFPRKILRNADLHLRKVGVAIFKYPTGVCEG